MEFKTACFTGHRPEKLGGYDESNPIADSVKESLKYVIEKLILEHNVTRFISGGALGVDQWAAEIVLELKTKHLGLILIIARPFPSQDFIWPTASKLRSKKILSLK